MLTHPLQFLMFYNMGAVLMFKRRSFGRLALIPGHYFTSTPYVASPEKQTSKPRIRIEELFWLRNNRLITQ